jgi:hypothetical protein
MPMISPMLNGGDRLDIAAMRFSGRDSSDR